MGRLGPRLGCPLEHAGKTGHEKGEKIEKGKTSIDSLTIFPNSDGNNSKVIKEKKRIGKGKACKGKECKMK